MKLQQIHIGLALALSLGMVASGCSREATAPASDAAAAAPVADAGADSNAHDADLHAQAASGDFQVPDDHVAWTPDAPLVEGMSRVRTALGGLDAQADTTTVIARADDVDAAVKYMFDNCKLDPEPDVALHAVLARLMAGSKALHANPADTTPVHDMHAAVQNYEHLFDDPGSAASAPR